MHQFFTRKEIKAKQKSKACLENFETPKCICLKSKRSEFISDTVLIYTKSFAYILQRLREAGSHCSNFHFTHFYINVQRQKTFLKTEEMKAGRGQVRETTFQVTTPWKNKSPYIVFFVTLKGKHIPFLHVSLHSGLHNTTLPSAGHHPHPKVMPGALGCSLRVWGYLYVQGYATIKTESSTEIHKQGHFLFHLFSCLK